MIKKIILIDNNTELKVSIISKKVIKRFPIKNKYKIRVDKKKSAFRKLNDISIKLVYIKPVKIETIIVSTIATTRLEKTILV